ncbi:hypothetical protein VKT23_015778 [Stygiomarasmius scandens]|uniref:CxC2-like cysteine cluster KDZ transposase-associated domain-containing protein n=1 Tax=Marasmiellus scandens TaxID=2682957 RepID=A0ABR1J107_9AGAR
MAPRSYRVRKGDIEEYSDETEQHWDPQEAPETFICTSDYAGTAGKLCIKQSIVAQQSLSINSASSSAISQSQQLNIQWNKSQENNADHGIIEYNMYLEELGSVHTTFLDPSYVEEPVLNTEEVVVTGRQPESDSEVEWDILGTRDIGKYRGYLSTWTPPGEACPCPESSAGGLFVVGARNGIHEINLRFCGCRGWADKTGQLLQARLFPATVDNPQTAFTFKCLEQFQMLNFVSKITPFEFYTTLMRLTDNTFTAKVPDRYEEVLRVLREWRHTRMMKRTGRAYDERGPTGTKLGECALLCPACPIPKINIPVDYAKMPDRWKYTLFVGIDANFRLKRLDVSNEERDPGLNNGYAYIIETKMFNSYLQEFGEVIVDDKSTCNDHNALKQASMKGGKGTASTGIGTVDCARHDMKRPVSLGDLQKGER